MVTALALFEAGGQMHLDKSAKAFDHLAHRAACRGIRRDGTMAIPPFFVISEAK